MVTDKGNKVEWDYLVLATGAVPAIPSIPIEGGSHVFTVHHPADAVRLREILYSMNSIGIIGTGYIGLEVAST